MLLIRPDGDTAHFREVVRTRLTPARLAEYAGTYTSEELDAQLVIAVRDNQLVLRRRPADEFALEPMYDDDFSSPIGSLRFSRDATGRVTGLGIYSGRIRNVRFARR
ncbi:MAG: DUF3471 domain-containing protein [Gemmatimonadaceae bacterium]